MEIKPVLIIESNQNGITLNESASDKKIDKFILSGIFTEFDIKNRNDRIYTSEKFLPHLIEFNERIKTLGAVYGEFDHPDVFDTSLTRVSHTVHSITHNESANRIDGSIRLLNTPNGKTAKALVLDGCPLFVSSRAAGVTESDGTVTIKKLFTYDAVADPGFASAKMNLNVMNESLGFNESKNLRIIDMSNESKINELFDMNKDDQVTKQQMEDYTSYLATEIPKIKEEILENIKEGMEPEKLEKMSEYYESLQENYTKMTKYLDYLADNIQILVSENKELKEQSENIVKHNDYLAENLEKSINYSNYLAEKVDKTIDYSEYIAESLSKSIDFSEYIAENVDKSIKYSEYLAENLDKTIDYSEYIAEHTEHNIEGYEMLSEYVDNSVKYSEYVAEQVDNNIAYSEYLAEHVDNNINYSEYIAENLSDTQAYSKYIAESLDKTIDVVNGEKLNEDINDDQKISDLKVVNVDKYYEEEESEEFPTDDELPNELSDIEEEEEELTLDTDDVIDTEGVIDTEEPIDTEGVIDTEEPIDTEGQIVPGDKVEIEIEGQEGEHSGEVISINPQDGFAIIKLDNAIQQEVEVQDGEEVIDLENGEEGQVQVDLEGQSQVQSQVQPQAQTQAQTQVQEIDEIEIHESKITLINTEKVFDETDSIKDKIAELISETKKRKASEEVEPHFFMFLSEQNKDTWKKLSPEDKEKTIVAINESTYTSEKDVLNIIRVTLENNKSEEEVLVDSIPEDLIDVWNGLNDTVKQSVLAQAKFYPYITKSDAKLESFWYSRDLDNYSTEPKKVLINENKNYIDDIKLDEIQVNRYLDIFKNL